MVHTREGCGFVVSCKINTTLLVVCSLIFAFSSTLISPTKAEDTATITHYELEVKQNQSHDSSAFTQGFLFHEGKIYESTGLYNHSSLREVTLEGELLRQVNLSDDEFGEGLALHNGTLVQLTWKEGVAYVWDLETFTLISNYTYQDEGWGLCSYGDNFIMSNGTSDLTIRDGDNFSIIDTVSVTYNGSPLIELNELECVGDFVYANVWHWEWIFIIDITSGEVIGTIDAASIYPEPGVGDVLNGIAFDSSNDTFWLTGKYWPNMHEVNWRAVSSDNGDNIIQDGDDSSENNSDNRSLLTDIYLYSIAIIFATLTFIFWGNGFSDLTRSRWVDNPRASTTNREEEE
jgi:glutamine cyclotransferase